VVLKNSKEAVAGKAEKENAMKCWNGKENCEHCEFIGDCADEPNLREIAELQEKLSHKCSHCDFLKLASDKIHRRNLQIAELKLKVKNLEKTVKMGRNEPFNQ
jgi:hypothetical protein